MKLKDAKYFGIKLSPNRIKNDKGQLIVTGCEFARTGEQKYHSSELGVEGDKFIYLKRPVEEVSDSKTVASFEGAPVTLDHPEDDVKVGVNYDKLAKGFATNVKYIADSDKEGHLQADFVITDADLIKKIENHEIEELSAGYNCDVDEKDWVQRHIRGNHIAVVEQARAGHQARLRDKAYSKSQNTLKIGDKEVKIVDSYSYELEEDGVKVKYTDYYTETASGKKKLVTTLKDDEWDDLRKIRNYPEKKVLEALKSIIPAKRYNEIKDNFKWADIRTLTKAEREKLFKKLDTVKDALVGKIHFDDPSKEDHWNTDLEFELNKKYLPEGWYTKEEYEDALDKMKEEAKNDKKTWYSISQYLSFNNLVKEPGVPYHVVVKDSESSIESKIKAQIKNIELQIKNLQKREKEIENDKSYNTRIDHRTGEFVGEEAKSIDLAHNCGKIKALKEQKSNLEALLKIKDSDNFELEDEINPIFKNRQDIDDKFQEVFYDTCFDISGFRNGNDSDEGSIYVVDINPWLDENCYRYVEDNYEDDFDEEYLDLACEYFEKEINKRLQDEGLYDQSDSAYVSSIDVGVTDWSGEEEFPINVHIYCKNVTK